MHVPHEDCVCPYSVGLMFVTSSTLAECAQHRRGTKKERKKEGRITILAKLPPEGLIGGGYIGLQPKIFPSLSRDWPYTRLSSRASKPTSLATWIVTHIPSDGLCHQGPTLRELLATQTRLARYRAPRMRKPAIWFVL